MAVKLVSSGGGSVTIADPSSTASNFTLNPPLRSGQLAVDGPAFRAYLPTSAQNVTSATWTKATLSAETFDTNNNFDSTASYRFQPSVAGYYQLNACLYGNSSTTESAVLASFYKNGAQGTIFGASVSGGTTTFGANGLSLCDVIYLNGSTDYVELYGYVASGGSPNFSSTHTFMSGSLVRAA